LTPQEPETYLAAADLYRHLLAKGLTIRSTIDCMVARLAEENDVLLLSKNRDLQIIVDSRLLDLRVLPLA
jgi:predicted nucleic acid-binding protein